VQVVSRGNCFDEDLEFFCAMLKQSSEWKRTNKGDFTIFGENAVVQEALGHKYQGLVTSNFKFAFHFGK